jgi:hypothetical protein
MIHVLRKILATTTAVTDIVPSTRISLVNARQGMERPYVVVDLEETSFENSNSGISGEIYNVLVYVTDTKISDAWTLHSAIKNALSQYSGTVTVDSIPYVVDHVVLVDVMTDAHELHDFYIVAMLFNVYITE